MPPLIKILLAASLGLLGLALCVQFGTDLVRGHQLLQHPFEARTADYVGSETCAQCHGDRQQSWYSTYHRTMTQEAGPHSVQGAFDGRALDYWGVRVRPVRDNGEYYFEYYDLENNELLDRYRVDRTVGSNRYQQYLTRFPEDETYVRLHYLWHNGDQRWVHMNAAFLGPDDKPFSEHVAIWNQNCIFCHNTGPVPRMTNYEELGRRAAAGEPVSIAHDSRFESDVAELGIACETCHGPGGEHVQRAQAFWTRTAMRLARGRDNSIVNPVRLDHERGSQVCGQCHAQRVPADPTWIREWIHTGPSYRPGDDLHEHVTPVYREMQVPVAGQEDLFMLRFWGDGTPRLTAYEYQGLLQSPCHQQAELSCMDCHSMHAGDPAGQITDRNRGNAPCLRCHQDFRRETELVAHTRHPADGAGSLCYNCHMPHLNYGVMAIHRSHRIEIPDAARDAAAGRPNACLNCHVDQSIAWAAAELGAWPGGGDPQPLFRADGGDRDMAEIATVLAGDPVQKAITAWRAGRPDSALRGRERAWLVPFLLEGMADIYPSTRRFSHHSLQAILQDWPDTGEVSGVLAALDNFDFIADPPLREAERHAAVTAWAALDKSEWPRPSASTHLAPDFEILPELRDRLVELGRRLDKQISIGE